MNNKDHRSVISRLDDIENLIRNEETISDKIGESFEDYLHNSKIYLFESDDRKFKNFINKNKNLNLTLLVICILITLIDIILEFKCKTNIIKVLICDSFIIMIPVLNFIIISKQKSKMVSNSKWLANKFDFYIHENKLNLEIKKGEMYVFSSVLEIVLILLFLLYSLLNISEIFGFVNTICFGIIIAIYPLWIVRGYRYKYYIFEKSNSYVKTDLNEVWEKHLM